MSIKDKNYFSAIGLTILSSAFVGSSAIFGKYLIPLVNLPMLIFLRLAIPALILWWMTYMLQMPKKFQGSQTLLIQRSLMSFLTQACFFIYLLYGSAFNATLLLMTSPLFAPIISRIADKTPIKPQQWLSLSISFVGIILILKPGSHFFQWSALIGLASGLFHASSQWTYHKMSKATSPLVITMHMFSYGALFAAVPLIFFSLYTGNIGFHGVTLTASKLSYILMISIALAIAAISTQILRGRAFSKVNKAHSLMPFLYTAVVFTGLYDTVFFDVIPDEWTLIGAALVFLGLNVLVLVRFINHSRFLGWFTMKMKFDFNNRT